MADASNSKFYSLQSEPSGGDLLGGCKNGINKKCLVVVVVLCAVCLGIGVIIGHFSYPAYGGGDASSTHCTEDGFSMTQFIVDNVDKDRIRENLRNYSGEPRLAGTPQAEHLARIIAQHWTDNGLDVVHLASYDVLLSFPNKTSANVIQLVDKVSGAVQFESRTDETPLRPEENNSHVVPAFNAYSPAGDVTGDLVYVNYGTIDDFEYLANNRSIDFSGKVVITRYGSIYRGDKLRNAERFNVSAMILYSDPSDVNIGSEEPYPKSWWMPPTGMERGTVAMFDGDPTTPMYPSLPDAYRIPIEDLKTMPKIPCQVISYGEAKKFLMGMKGEVAPDHWQGGLNFTYFIGPGYSNGSNLKVRVIVKNYFQITPVHNVIGYIKGSEEPDRYVLMGNHHDAWVFGAVDPLSGSAAITEITRVFGLMLKQGHRPKRTIVFCSWDGEESSLLGSYEWVEDKLKLLNQRGVAYLNLDFAADGNFTVAAGTSPLLQDALYEAAKKVPSPDPSVGKTLYDLWKARPLGNASDDLYVTYSLGSVSDMAAFYQRAGVPSVDIWMTYDWNSLPILSYPQYHTSYDTFYTFEMFIDPGFTASKTMTQLLAIAASDLANADILPFKVERYSRAVDNFLTSLMESFGTQWRQKNVSVDALISAVENFKNITYSFQQALDRATSQDKNYANNTLWLRRLNDCLMQLERAFLDTEGLPGRPYQKHVMFAPSQFDSYKDNSFPGILDTMHNIERGSDEWELLKQQVSIATFIIQSAASALKEVGL